MDQAGIDEGFKEGFGRDVRADLVRLRPREAGC
jgi:hypothetical protein